MPTNLKFRSWLEYEIESIFANDTATPKVLPDKTKFYTLVGKDTSLTDISSKALVIAGEQIKTASNNYSRFNPNFGSEALYDSSNKRWLMPIATWTISLPESIQYNYVALLADARVESNRPVTMTLTAGSPTTFTTATDHGLDSGSNEEVMITDDDGGAFPTGLSPTTIYYAINISATEFQLSTTPLSAGPQTPLELTSAGTAGLRLRYAKGRLVGFRKEDQVETLAANAPLSWNFNLTNAAYFGVGQGT
jgi:hypothetical protein